MVIRFLSLKLNTILTLTVIQFRRRTWRKHKKLMYMNDFLQNIQKIPKMLYFNSIFDHSDYSGTIEIEDIKMEDFNVNTDYSCKISYTGVYKYGLVLDILIRASHIDEDKITFSGTYLRGKIFFTIYYKLLVGSYILSDPLDGGLIIF